MKLLILSPDHEIFNGAVKSVKVPAIGGQFEILAKHAPIVASLGKGKIRVINAKDEKSNIEIEDGFVEVLNDEVVILVGQAEVKA
jgi:F-type H+-transporting ATPase subunit epsilon